jgi:hypothetical protein
LKILVCGGRDYNDHEFLFRALDHVHKDKGPVTGVIHGGASGADGLAGAWATAARIPVTAVHAKWNLYGKAAGPLRNREMLGLKPDLIVAFPGGRGTEDMCRQALDNGFTVYYPAGRLALAADTPPKEG